MKKALEIIGLGYIILGMGKVIGLFDKGFSFEDSNPFAAFPKFPKYVNGVAEGIAALRKLESV